MLCNFIYALHSCSPDYIMRILTFKFSLFLSFRGKSYATLHIGFSLHHSTIIGENSCPVLLSVTLSLHSFTLYTIGSAPLVSTPRTSQPSSLPVGMNNAFSFNFL
ncbi:hypothetical protein ATV_gp08 [Bicaudavirus pozzuoliense]|uniref:Uncharacterized protein ORF104a n=1 Tax=Acidianus two-tailed virus TaxID=315953 RepID=Y104A_ATV|nr:hypothetical protein ATV_gp08 [Acidianus two-tailed virus]Q3V4W9.1 RecName: Full=Uncharacterized protein ORF104a [Acidianus two-tailed virus]CAI59845.1 hypothetical protein [Acidianus two-tailed virus]